MAESLVQVTSGGGPKLHTWQRTIGANNIEDEFVLAGEYPLASYTVMAANVSAATAAAHIMQVMAGASLNVRVRRIRVRQRTAATTAAAAGIGLYRLTSAGTGGTAITPGKLDNGDSAAGATAMTLPTAKGAEGVELLEEAPWVVAATTVIPLYMIDWVWQPNEKPLIIPAGATNGIALKVSGNAALTVDINIEIVETSFL